MPVSHVQQTARASYVFCNERLPRPNDSYHSECHVASHACPPILGIFDMAPGEMPVLFLNTMNGTGPKQVARPPDR